MTDEQLEEIYLASATESEALRRIYDAGFSDGYAEALTVHNVG